MSWNRALQSGPYACKEGDESCCPSREDDKFMHRLDGEVHRVNRYTPLYWTRAVDSFKAHGHNLLR